MSDFSIPTGTTGVQRDALALVNQTLARYGLDGLSDWAWQQILSGASADEVYLSLRETPQYKQRFPAIEERRRQGLSPISEDAYISYESTASQLLQGAGIPRQLVTPAAISDLISADVSPKELESRITGGIAAVQAADPLVRQTFTDWFGVDGDGALAALFLDPELAQPVLENMVRTAEVGGTGRRFGLDLSYDLSNEAATLGLDGQAAAQQLAKVAQANVAGGLFDATVSENTGLSASEEGASAALVGDVGAAAAIQKRQQSRQASFQGGGGALYDQAGTSAGSRGA